MSIVSDANINLWMSLTDGTADSTMAESIRDEVEAYVKGFCHRDFVETTYVAEAYDGTGSKDLQLKQYPVTRVYSLATTSVNALKVYNSGSASTAFAAVISAPPAAVTGMRLTEDGADDSTDLTFATSATITAINAVVDGLTNWNAEIQGGWGAKKSNLLIATPDLYALSTNFAMFKIPDDYVTQYEVYPDEGRLSYWGGFPVGRRNIIVTYTGGYSTCPADLQEAIKIVVQEVYRLRKEDAMGLTHLQLGDLRMDFEAVCPSKALAVFKRYQRRDHWFGGQ